MNKVIGLHGAVPAGEPVPDVIETLEGLLDKAKSGEIQAFAYAVARRAGNGFATGWTGNGGTREHLGCAIAHLGHRFHTDAFCEFCDNG